MDSKLILNRIIEAYSLKNDADLALFLGITPQNLSNWRSQNTINWRILFNKCVFISYDWLITGEGNMLKSDEIGKNQPQNVTSTTQNGSTIDTLVTMLAEKDRQLASLISQLAEKNSMINKLLEMVETQKKVHLSTMWQK